MERLSRRQIEFGVLEVLSKTKKAHKINLIGRGRETGALEAHFGFSFSLEDKTRADQAFERLKSAGMIQATYSDLVDPEKWVRITDAGIQALKRGALDDLDEALLRIGKNLVDIRDGGWSALASGGPDSVRQAAHSGRELIDQVLKEGAPDFAIKEEEGFVPDRSSSTGVTRRHRLRYLMKQNKGVVSQADLDSVEKGFDFLITEDRKLMAESHTRDQPNAQTVEDCLRSAEMILRRLLT